MPHLTPTTQPVPSGTYRLFAPNELSPNPLNPRKLFDREPLATLRESIRKNGILVPITAYFARNGRAYIIDGERRWRCASELVAEGQDVNVPANIIDPPSKVANILSMFNIHNLREQWELMPTALSLKVVMQEIGEHDDEKLAELTHLSLPNVRRCKILLNFDPKYQAMMLLPDPEKRVKANFFIELKPVLDLYEKLPKRCRGGKDRDGLTDHFLDLYQRGNIPSVIHFRRVLEAHDLLERTDRFDEFLSAAETLARDRKATIRRLFDPLVAEDRSVSKAEDLCKQFLRQLRALKVDHATTHRQELIRVFRSVESYMRELVEKIEG